jgi:hypothetical protein
MVSKQEPRVERSAESTVGSKKLRAKSLETKSIFEKIYQNEESRAKGQKMRAESESRKSREKGPK